MKFKVQTSLSILFALAIITASCTFNTSVDPKELDNTISGFGYYNSAVLDSNRKFHDSDSILKVKISQLYIHSECSLDSIIPSIYFTTSNNDTTRFNIGYTVFLTSNIDPNCPSKGAVYDTTFQITPTTWRNVQIVAVNKYGAERSSDPDLITDTTTLDTILILDGTYNQETIRFDIDSLFKITRYSPTGSDSINTHTLSEGYILDYEYKDADTNTYDAVWQQEICTAQSADCDSTYSDLHIETILDTLDSTEVLLKNIRELIHRRVCIDSLSSAIINKPDTITPSGDSIMLHVCDTAHFIDSTLIDPINIADSTKDSLTLNFYEQCIREEEIVCKTLDTIISDNYIGDSTIVTKPIEEKKRVTKIKKCYNDVSYCSKTPTYDSIPDSTTYTQITPYLSVAYLEEINKCDSLNFYNRKSYSYRYNGRIELYRELFEIEDVSICDRTQPLDTLVWDLSKFNTIITPEYRSATDLLPIRRRILDEFNNDSLNADSIKR